MHQDVLYSTNLFEKIRNNPSFWISHQLKIISPHVLNIRVVSNFADFLLMPVTECHRSINSEISLKLVKIFAWYHCTVLLGRYCDSYQELSLVSRPKVFVQLYQGVFSTHTKTCSRSYSLLKETEELRGSALANQLSFHIWLWKPVWLAFGDKYTLTYEISYSAFQYIYRVKDNR